MPGPGDAVAVESPRRGQAGVAPFPDEDFRNPVSGYRAVSREPYPILSSEGGESWSSWRRCYCRYLVGHLLSKAAAAERTSSAEALSILLDAARDQAQRHVRNKRSLAQRRRLA